MPKKNSWETNRNEELLEIFTSGTVKQVKIALKAVDASTWRDKEGNSLLHRVASAGARPSVTKILIEGVGQVDVPNSKGETPLALAAAGGRIKIAEILLVAGARPDAQDNQGRTALMRASDSGHSGVAELLVRHGANVNASDRHNETALMIASAWGYPRIVRTLARCGAVCEFTNKDGWTAKAFAEDLGHTEIVKVLEKYSKAKTREFASGMDSKHMAEVQVEREETHMAPQAA